MISDRYNKKSSMALQSPVYVAIEYLVGIALSVQVIGDTLNTVYQELPQDSAVST
jgi:hypothetical protein